VTVGNPAIVVSRVGDMQHSRRRNCCPFDHEPTGITARAFYNSELTSANLSQANFKIARFLGAMLAHARLLDLDLTGADLEADVSRICISPWPTCLWSKAATWRKGLSPSALMTPT
jgi:uncharacterized protein YjbI with pentapeptide repeats